MLQIGFSNQIAFSLKLPFRDIGEDEVVSLARCEEVAGHRWILILNGDDTAQGLAKALLGAEEAYGPKP